MVYVCVIPASLGADARVSVQDLENASTTNANAARRWVLLIWENTVNCRDAQAVVQALIMVFVTRKLRNVYVPRDGLGMIVVRRTAQEHLSVLATEAAAIQIQDGATASHSGLVKSANFHA